MSSANTAPSTPLRHRKSFSPSPRPMSFVSQDSIAVGLSTPDLTDCSDTATSSSSPSTPSSNSPPYLRDGVLSEETPTKPERAPRHSQTGSRVQTPTTITPGSPSTPCAKCTKPLFRMRSGGKFVTVPEESSKCLPPKSYHVECFRCAICDEPFEETQSGQAIFVRSSSGCCHLGVSVSAGFPYSQY